MEELYYKNNLYYLLKQNICEDNANIINEASNDNEDLLTLLTTEYKSNINSIEDAVKELSNVSNEQTQQLSDATIKNIEYIKSLL